MALAPYQKLALRWQPSQREDRIFVFIAVVCVVLSLVLGFYLTTLEVPEKTRTQRNVVPERVAKFIADKPKPKPPKVEPPKPKPKPPEPKPEPKKEPEKVKVVKDRPKPKPKQLTKEQKKARDKASQSGLMAHLKELNDLVETSDVSAQVQASIKKSAGGKESAGLSAEVLTANATKGSGGVDSKRFATKAGTSELSGAELATARAALEATAGEFTDVKGGDGGGGDGLIRSEEEITLVFDRHKSSLQSLYNRARRSNPGLKGKLVLEITILPDGTVSNVKVLNSELGDQKLISRLLARIRNFQFGARDVAVATVSYPIEFLPN